MNNSDKIYVAGHQGMVGSSIQRELHSRGFNNLLTRSRDELNLVDQKAVNNFFYEEKPAFVILSAAKVGGIYANDTYPADFIYQNIMIQANIIHAAFENNIDRLLFLGSSCIYPKHAKQPITEDSLLSGQLEPTNEPYAIAKIAGIKLCESYNRQHNTDFRSVMPSNLYGPNDNFSSKNSHVVPALIGRFHEAKVNNKNSVNVWGSGLIKREFLYVDEMAKASLFILNLDKKDYQKIIDPTLSHINIGSGVDISIKDLAELIKSEVDYKGEIFFDSSMPDGPPQKLLDITKLDDLGWRSSTSLEEGLKMTYKYFLETIN